MKLHYSQTATLTIWTDGTVLLPYEITLFSNAITSYNINVFVLLPYEITLFSNKCVNDLTNVNVLLPYEITLFSN